MLTPYSAFSNPAMMGQQMARFNAVMPSMPSIPVYQGPQTNIMSPPIAGPTIPQPGQGMPATNSVLSNVPALLKYLQQMRGGGANPAYGNMLANATDYMNSMGAYGPTNGSGQLLYGG